MTPLLSASGLAIPGRLQSTDLQLSAGEMTALIGPNGGGKTSLLRAMTGVEGASGAVSIAGEHLPAAGARRARLIGYMSSSREMGWDIPVIDAMVLGTGPVDEARVRQLLAEFELGTLAERPVTRLSTGERSRVLMARAIAASPTVLLLDEPLSNLDPYWVLRFLKAMGQCAERGGAVLCAVHDLALLDRFDRALLVSGGAVQADGPPTSVRDSEAFAASFRVRGGADGRWEVRPPEDRRSSP